MSVTAAAGFAANGMASGIKGNGALDLSLVATVDGRPVTAASVFTQNKSTAAPVVVTRRHLHETGGRAAAVVLNSGNANAATGRQGLATAEGACALVATALGCAPAEVLVCSTGLIGIPLSLGPFETHVGALVSGRNQDGGQLAAEAIMTTDTHAKQVVVRRSGFTLGGMAKGAAMLAPNMATMLAVLTTDAAVDAEALQVALGRAVAESFNRLTVDGCTSTNDTVIVLASGAAGPADVSELGAALTAACTDLALQMAGDAEGATKTVRVTVTGAASNAEALAGARKIAESQLVKCSWYGKDPYWGRVVSELGSAGIEFDPDDVSVAYGGITVCRGGVHAEHDLAALALYMEARNIELVADLGLGAGTGWVLTNDLTHAYVDENMGTS